MNRDYVVDITKKLLMTPSPSGFCQEVLDHVIHEADSLGYQWESTPKGNLIVSVPGKQSDVLGLSGHVDTLGAMVRSITSDGTLKLTSVGGFMMHAIEGEYCQIHTRDSRTYTGTILTNQPSIHVYKGAKSQDRDEKAMEVRIDEKVSSQEDVKALGINVGDYISFDARTQVVPSGFIKSRHLDDKASVGVLLGLLKWLSDNSITPEKTLKIIITTYEEVGHGAAYIPEDIRELIAVDMGAMGDDLSCTEYDVSICAKDSSGPYDYEMTTQLINIAKNQNLNHAVDIYPFYGSDGSAALKGGNNIRCALVGPGVHASHSMERTHIDALDNTFQLLAHYITQ